jgi:hypothetical protein
MTPMFLTNEQVHYYLFTDRLKTWALDKFGPNTSQLVPFEIYLEDEDKNNKFTGKFALFRAETTCFSVMPRKLGMTG